jgi:hypothetical protein
MTTSQPHRDLATGPSDPSKLRADGDGWLIVIVVAIAVACLL